MHPPPPRFLGIPLHNTKANFVNIASDFLQQLKHNLHIRFSDTDPVAKATRFLDFFRWPASDGIALASYANESVHLIATHFAAVLGPLPKVVHQFLALKVHLRERLKAGSFPLCHAFQEKAEPALVKALVAGFYQVWDASPPRHKGNCKTDCVTLVCNLCMYPLTLPHIVN